MHDTATADTIARRQMARKPRNYYYGSGCHRRIAMTVPLDPYILDTLMADLVGHDRHPSAYLVYLALTRRAVGAHRSQVTIALQDIAEATGLSKRTVQSALAHLVYRRCLTVERASLTAVPTYTVLRPWRRGS